MGREYGAFDVVVVEHDHESIVQARGELDVTALSRLREALRRCLQRNADVVVDVGDLAFIDAGGLSLLVEFRNRAHELRLGFRVVSASPFVARVITLAELDEVLGLEAAP